MADSEAAQVPILDWLADPRSHGVAEPTRRIETQGAVVILVGALAYKVRRAIRLPFLDYSTLEKRRAACEVEMTLNQEAAPNVYLGAVAIRRSGQGFAFDSEGEIVEWATRMRRFDENATFDRLAERGELTSSLIDSLADAIRASHTRAPLRDGAPAIVAMWRYLDQNRDAFAERPDFFASASAARLDRAAREALTNDAALLMKRASRGCVRRCHGDLHLRNIAVIEGRAVPFDAIEFDDAIATGDVLYDFAFPLMDLWERGLTDHANRLFNRYLATSEESMLDGLPALPFFLALRSAIRAKVVAANLAHLHGEARQREGAAARRYFDFGLMFLRPEPPRLVAVGGLSGSGKSALSGLLAVKLGRAPGALWLRSDVERKHMLGVEASARLPAIAYGKMTSEQTYARMARRAELALRAGHGVILDAVHASGAARARAFEIAARIGVPFTGFWLEAPSEIRAARVDRRVNDASDASAEIAAAQAAEPLRETDWVAIDASQSLTSTLAAVERALGLTR